MTAPPTELDLAPGYDRQRVRDAIRDNFWIHFTQMAQFRDPEHRPLVLVKGDGSTVWDDQGRAYLDCLAGIYSVNAGYGQRRIIEAMTAQLEQIPYVNAFGTVSVPGAVLADRLGDLAPVGGNARVFFTSGGSEAVESALKLAKQYQTQRGFPHRWKTISRRVAYHGTTMGALSVNGLTGARTPFGPLVPGARHAPMSHRYRCPYCQHAAACTLTCYEEIERLVEFEGPDQIAAIITEPVQNAGGCIPPGSMDYFKKIRELCTQTGILMIMDEVICGFGRLGELFGSTYFGVEPDLITVAKGITSSYAPLGAVLVRKSVADVFDEGPGFQHGLTFGGHPVSCAAALANLDLMLEQDMPGQARDTGAYLRKELEAAFHDHPNVGDIRGAGLFLGIELVKDRTTKESPIDPGLGAGSDALSPIGSRPTNESQTEPGLLDWLTDQMREHGLILRNDDRGDPTTQICPPLIITRDECDRVVRILRHTIDELGRRLGTVPTIHPST